VENDSPLSKTHHVKKNQTNIALRISNMLKYLAKTLLIPFICEVASITSFIVTIQQHLLPPTSHAYQNSKLYKHKYITKIFVPPS
jgi:hypothetical protein